MSPRHYAEAYMIAKGDKEAERKAVKDCPREWQSLVKKHVEIRRARER